MFPSATGHACQISPIPKPERAHLAARKSLKIREMQIFLKLAPPLLVLGSMSVLRTMSLIIAAALVAVGGSAVAALL